MSASIRDPVGSGMHLARHGLAHLPGSSRHRTAQRKAVKEHGVTRLSLNHGRLRNREAVEHAGLLPPVCALVPPRHGRSSGLPGLPMSRRRRGSWPQAAPRFGRSRAQERQPRPGGRPALRDSRRPPRTSAGLRHCSAPCSGRTGGRGSRAPAKWLIDAFSLPPSPGCG